MTNRTDEPRAWLSPDGIGIAIAVAAAVTIGVTLVGRPGYGPDEEITWFAVEGIKAHGVPTLPSGLTYFRGPSYSYLAWLSSLIGGAGFEPYRWLGVLCLAGVIVATALLARALFDRGLVAAWLIALAPVAVAGGAYARFYMPFAAVCTLTLIAATRMRDDPYKRAWFVAGCVAARSLHEFGMLLALVPAAGWLCSESSRERRSFAWLTLITAAVLVAEHALLLWLPCIAWNCESATWGFSSSGLPGIAGTAIPVAAFATPAEIVSAMVVAGLAAAAIDRAIQADRVFTIAAAAAAAVFANGVVAAIIILWVIARPSHAGKVVRAGALAAAAGSIAWVAIIFLRSNALVDARFVWGLLQGSFTFPWSAMRFLATEQPILTAALLLGVWRGAFGLPTQSIPARTLAVLLYLQLLSFGVTGTDVRSRFLVLILPLIAVFAGAGILGFARTVADALARRAIQAAQAIVVAIAVALVIYVSTEQAAAIFPHRDPGPGDTWRTQWQPPVALSSLDIDRHIITPGDVVVTNDELAALLLLGRIDFWWPPDATSAQRYSFTDPHGQPRGLYGGAPLITDSSALRILIQENDTRGVVVALFNTGKFGFDRPALQVLVDENRTAELEQRPSDWFVARFPPRR